MSDNRTATEIAAQIWCKPGLTHKVMDVDLAYAFAEEIEALQKRLSDAENARTVAIQEMNKWAREAGTLSAKLSEKDAMLQKAREALESIRDYWWDDDGKASFTQAIKMRDMARKALSLLSGVKADTRCKHDVWKGDHCYACEKEKKVVELENVHSAGCMARNRESATTEECTCGAFRALRATEGE